MLRSRPVIPGVADSGTPALKGGPTNVTIRGAADAISPFSDIERTPVHGRRSFVRRNRNKGRRPGRQLTLTRVVDRLGEHPRRFLGRVESHRVLGGDEVQAPLRFPRGQASSGVCCHAAIVSTGALRAGTTGTTGTT